MASAGGGRVALVTGSTSGIGEGIGKALAQKGYSVVLHGSRPRPEGEVETLKKAVKSQYNVQVDYICSDLSNRADTKLLIQKVLEIYPKGIDVLVNNAGMQHVAPIDTFPEERWDTMIATMLTAPFLLSQAFLPKMREKGWGRIINISSAQGLVATPGKCAYTSSKHGINGLTKVVALEAAGTGVTCNSVCPGFVETPLIKTQVQALADERKLSYQEALTELVGRAHPSKTPIQVEELGELVCFLCTDAASQMTGSIIPIDGGITAR